MTSTSTFTFTLGIVIAFLIIFPVWWSFVCWIISRFGWARLAERYATDLQPVGDTRHMQSMRVNMTRYSATVTMTLNDVGFYAEPMILFRPGHKRLLIPWTELHNPKPSLMRIWPMVSLDVGFPTVGSIALTESVLLNGPPAAQQILAAERRTIA